ncbi:MAG TPA: hypothetical protein ENI23_07510 [bacterium]|nr:hypothetical protein [bacterium]
MFPTDDKLMRSQEDLDATKLLPFLPATERELIRRLRIGGNRIRSMLLGLQRQGLVQKDEKSGFWFKPLKIVEVPDENTEGVSNGD